MNQIGPTDAGSRSRIMNQLDDQPAAFQDSYLGSATHLEHDRQTELLRIPLDAWRHCRNREGEESPGSRCEWARKRLLRGWCTGGECGDESSNCDAIHVTLPAEVQLPGSRLHRDRRRPSRRKVSFAETCSILISSGPEAQSDGCGEVS